MTLTPHAIAGAALASLTPNKPLVGFAVGFLSHFVLDAIPHWDYKLSSFKEDKENSLNNDMVLNLNFVKDLFKIGLDILLGIFISIAIFVFYFSFPITPILYGALGAIAPDFLQFAYMKWRHEPLISLQRFHLWIHSEKRL